MVYAPIGSDKADYKTFAVYDMLHKGYSVLTLLYNTSYAVWHFPLQLPSDKSVCIPYSFSLSFPFHVWVCQLQSCQCA